VVDYLTSLLGDHTFDDLRIPVSLVAVDLKSRQQVILCQGQLVDAVRATITIPGIFPPVERGDQLLVDGGVLNNLPADVVGTMGADVTIAVDVHSRLGDGPFAKMGKRRYVPNGAAETLDFLWQSLDLMLGEIQHLRLVQTPPDVFIQPSIPADITTLGGFLHAAEIIVAGEVAAQAALRNIRKYYS